MATTKEFHDYIVENLQKVGDVATRKMMGEYCVYYQGKLIGDICDNCLYVKPTESVLRLMPDADRAYPYEGSKTLMAVVENVEDTEFMEKLLSAMVKELPEPKKKAKAKEKAKPKKDAGPEEKTAPTSG